MIARQALRLRKEKEAMLREGQANCPFWTFQSWAGLRTDIGNHGALTICLHAAGKPASVRTGLGLLGGGCSFDSVNQEA